MTRNIKPLSGNTSAPLHFTLLQIAACISSENSLRANEVFSLEIRNNGFEFWVQHLDHASRQWRKADAFSGGTFDGFSEAVAESYSNLIKLTLSVAALEQYCKVFGREWHQLGPDILHTEFQQTSLLRYTLENTPASKIRNSLGNNLSAEWDRFIQGETASILRPAVALRHAAAHGEVWGASQLSPLLTPLADHILDAVKAHCEVVSSDISSH
ncbi:hypothetical protein GGQ68_003398 [Sagittula marina]|uniref:Uncharacterized protein n=1 Tax=Sagittula marina TaxID=943940 RepID=A0A7W6DQP8_9RHOB|nr:hypothetical protein [Sagittula marina]MBB3987054.1 hypothetical protein [Sagittula marina]